MSIEQVDAESEVSQSCDVLKRVEQAVRALGDLTWPPEWDSLTPYPRLRELLGDFKTFLSRLPYLCQYEVLQPIPIVRLLDAEDALIALACSPARLTTSQRQRAEELAHMLERAWKTRLELTVSYDNVVRLLRRNGEAI